MTQEVRIVVGPRDFRDWPGLLALLHANYAYMAARIDPPSSLLRMDAAEFEKKSREETMILAWAGERLAGCLFAALREDCVYVGKLAVDAPFRGRGIARRLMLAAEALARAHLRPFMELQTRIELTENHAAFASLGFAKVNEYAHPGYDRPTSITMRKKM
jgi:GNAT superfamily N-acetyltransferase